LRNQNRPLLVGEISLWIGLNLKQTKKLLEELVERELVRELTDEELRTFKAHKGFAFVLSNPALIPMGDVDSIPEGLV
jgi:predicted transcriptional regulator